MKPVLIAIVLTTLFSPFATAQGYPTAKTCEGYRVDPLKIMRPGSNVALAKGTVVCMTLEAYDEYTRLIVSREFAKAAEIQRMRVCARGAQDAETRAQVLRIVNYPTDRGCVMEIAEPGSSRRWWTDVSMVREVFAID